MVSKDLTFRLFGEDSTASSSLRRLSANAETASQSINRSLSKTHAGFAGAIAGITGAATGAAISGIGSAVSAGFSAAKTAVIGFNSTLQQSTIGFTTMLGSAAKAKDFVGQLQDFAKATPFDFQGLVQNSNSMLGMGIAAKDVIPDLTALGDSVSSVGGDSTMLNNTISAFGQTMAKGTLDMGNMNQLLQGGVPNALKILASSYKVTTGEMVKMISSGKVQSSDALPRLIKGIEQGTKSTAALGGMMNKQSVTFQGAMSNIGDAATQLTAKAFKPLFDQASAGANRLAGLLGSPKMTVWAGAITKALQGALGTIHKGFAALTSGGGGGIGKFFQSIGKTLGPLIPDLLKTARSLSPIGIVLKGLGPQLPGIVKSFAAAAVVIGGGLLQAVQNFAPVFATVLKVALAVVVPLLKMPGVITAIVAAFAIWKAATMAFTAVQLLLNIALDANPVGIVVLAIGALIAVVVLLVTHWKEVCGFLQTVWAGVCKWLGDSLNTLGQVWAAAWAALTGAVGAAWKAVSGAVDTGIKAVLGFFDGVGGWLVDTGKNLIQGLIDGIKGAIGFVTDTVKNIAGGVIGTFKNVLGIHSPSKVFHGFGTNIGQGLHNGILGTRDQVGKAAESLAQTVIGMYEKTSKIRIARPGADLFITKHGISKATENAALHDLNAGTKQIEEIAKRRSVVADRLKTAQDALKSALDDRKSYAAGVKSTTMSAGDVTTLGSAGDMVQRLHDLVAHTKTFRTVMRQLAGKGIDRVTYGELAQAGVAGGGLEAAQSLLANPLDFRQVVDLQKQLNAAAGGLGADTSVHQYRRTLATDRGRVTDLKTLDTAYAHQQRAVAASTVRKVANDVHVHINLSGHLYGSKTELAKAVADAIRSATRSGAISRNALKV